MLYTFTLNKEWDHLYVTLIHNSIYVLDVKKFSKHLEERPLSDWKAQIWPKYQLTVLCQVWDTFTLLCRIQISYVTFIHNSRLKIGAYTVLVHRPIIMSWADQYTNSSFTTCCQICSIFINCFLLWWHDTIHFLIARNYQFIVKVWQVTTLTKIGEILFLVLFSLTRDDSIVH